ncbi:unnamed protein product [Rotaria magnacalcarata]|uniref:Uncharacterized protein n=3 Tax=Rotaria magnacalcarata TaxID=392030 RepID=A0A815XG70_9BILA|nr:unnamed protein product [Rotaria magnacalcarata]
MCERSPLFLVEAKSITLDLLKRSLELFDICFHLVLHYRLDEFFLKREQKRDYDYFSLYKPCKLNYNIISDIDTYLHRLSTSCRLAKSNLRSLHASRMTSSNDYIVIDDEIHELVNIFQVKINQQFQSKQKDENYDSKHDEEYHHALTLFRKISQFYQLIIMELYGVHTVRNSHILQPIAINIIRLLLSIANKLKRFIQTNSPNLINFNHFRIQPHDEVCSVDQSKNFGKTKSKFRLIEIHANNSETSTE